MEEKKHILVKKNLHDRIVKEHERTGISIQKIVEKALEEYLFKPIMKEREDKK